MFYIFNKQDVCIGSCNVAPDEGDLAGRGEYAIEIEVECKVGWSLDEDGTPCAPIVPPLTLAEMAACARKLRDLKLTGFDRDLYRNQFFWGTLTAEQQGERMAYRQALLDVPQQADFPTGVNWPVYPTL